MSELKTFTPTLSHAWEREQTNPRFRKYKSGLAYPLSRLRERARVRAA